MMDDSICTSINKTAIRHFCAGIVSRSEYDECAYVLLVSMPCHQKQVTVPHGHSTLLFTSKGQPQTPKQEHRRDSLSVTKSKRFFVSRPIVNSTINPTHLLLNITATTTAPPPPPSTSLSLSLSLSLSSHLSLSLSLPTSLSLSLSLSPPLHPLPSLSLSLSMNWR